MLGSSPSDVIFCFTASGGKCNFSILKYLANLGSSLSLRGPAVAAVAAAAGGGPLDGGGALGGGSAVEEGARFRTAAPMSSSAVEMALSASIWEEGRSIVKMMEESMKKCLYHIRTTWGKE
jgi:hypothetical protein